MGEADKNYWISYALILFGGTAILCSPFLFRRYRGKNSFRWQTFIENTSLGLLSVFLTLMGLEFYFKVFFAQSDGFRYTLASRNWYQRYWYENSLHYRDKEWTKKKLNNKTRVMIVGDSFVAGAGIANPDDRFADQLGQLLGDDYAIMIVASPGWDTAREISAVLNYPYQPDILILSYHINDIKGAAYQSGVYEPQIRQNPPVWLLPLVQNSYVMNFIYWRLMRLGPQEWAITYWEWLQTIHQDPEIKTRHQQELLTIINRATLENIPLYVVVFPNLMAIEESQPMIQPVLELFQQHAVPSLDVSEIVAGRDPGEITVNPVDAHPNEVIHREVAEHLYWLMTQQGKKASAK